jgi:hypothetical protein
VKKLSFEIPGAVITYNYLCDQMPVEWRESDLLFVKLPNGNTIDVGWYPACDPTGRFKITLSDSVQNQIDVSRVSDIDQLVGIIEGMALRSRQSSNRVASTSVDLIGSPHNAAQSSSSTSMAPVVYQNAFPAPQLQVAIS